MRGDTIAQSVDLTSTPDAVFAVVSDLPGMGRFSLENLGGEWRHGATGPSRGATFTGRNRQGRASWSTRATVVECDPPTRFRFDVTYLGVPVSTWSFDIAARGDTVTLTETWRDNRPRWFAAVTSPLVANRAEFTSRSIAHTLSRMKEFLEN